MLNNIQALRAFAAINVLVFHLIETFEIRGLASPLRFFKLFEGWGQNGVDVFFVISGFVMYHTQINKLSNWRDFLTARILRIVPLYWIVTTAYLTVMLALPNLFRSQFNALQTATSYGFMSQLVTGGRPVIYVGWTLEWEFLFYMVFSLGLFFRSRAALLVIIAASFSVVALGSGTFLVFEFALGMIAAHLFHRTRVSHATGLLVAAFGFTLLCVSLFVPMHDIAADRFFVWGVPSFFIVLGAAWARQTSSPALAYLGDASYSIYLIQIPALPVFYFLITKGKIAINSDIYTVLCTVAITLIGCAVHSFLEKPVTGALRNGLRTSRRGPPIPDAAALTADAGAAPSRGGRPTPAREWSGAFRRSPPNRP